VLIESIQIDTYFFVRFSDPMMLMPLRFFRSSLRIVPATSGFHGRRSRVAGKVG